MPLAQKTLKYNVAEMVRLCTDNTGCMGHSGPDNAHTLMAPLMCDGDHLDGIRDSHCSNTGTGYLW